MPGSHRVAIGTVPFSADRAGGKAGERCAVAVDCRQIENGRDDRHQPFREQRAEGDHIESGKSKIVSSDGEVHEYFPDPFFKTRGR